MIYHVQSNDGGKSWVIRKDGNVRATAVYISEFFAVYNAKRTLPIGSLVYVHNLDATVRTKFTVEANRWTLNLT